LFYFAYFPLKSKFLKGFYIFGFSHHYNINYRGLIILKYFLINKYCLLMDKHHPFIYNSWLYLLIYYTFHHEGLHYDYIELVII